MKYGASTFAFCACIAFVSTASAQEPGDDKKEEARRVETVVVTTATRSATALERLPAQIDVIDREQMEQNNTITLADALLFSPGINAVQSGPAGAITSVFSRGSNSKHTLALFDGIRLNDASTPNGQYNFGQDMLGDAERVEVVRGPLSSVYGSDAVGGVVNIIPRIGAETGFSPYFEVSGGELDTYRGLVGASGTQDRLSYNATLERFETGGYDQVPERMTTSTGDPDGGEFTTLTGLVRFELTNQVFLDGLYRRREASSEFDTFSGGPTGFQRADSPSAGVGKDNYDIIRIGGGWRSLDGTVETQVRAGRVANSRNSVNLGAVTDRAEGDRDFVEAIGTWQPTGLSALIEPSVSFGVQYQNESIDVVPQFSNPLSREESAYGAYLLTTVGLTDSFDVTASARMDDFEFFGSQSTYNAGAVYRLKPVNTRFTVAYGTSFKAPTLSERFSTSPFTRPNPDLIPEEGRTWEAGFRTELGALGRPDAVRFGATYFDSEIDNLIENVFNFVSFTGQNRNVGKAEITGYETFAEFEPNDFLRLRVDYTFTDAINGNTDRRLLRRPPHNWSAALQLTPTERMSVSMRWLYVGSRADVIYNDNGSFTGSGPRTDAYEIVTLSGQYDLTESVELFGSVNNLFDETYEQPNAFRGAPRTVSVGIRGRF